MSITTMASETRKPRIVREKAFYKMLLTLAVPVTLQNIVVFLTQMLDTVMLGEIGDVAVSASSLANQPFFIFNMLTFGLGSGAAVLTSQYWGMQKIGPIKVILTMIIKFSMAAGALLTLTVFFFPEQIMGIFINDPEVIAAGADYLRIICWAYFFFGFTNVFYTAIRSVEAVKIAMVSNMVALVTNGTLNYILIFGKLGAPAMGIKGAATATLIARLVEFCIAFIYMAFLDKRLKIRFRDFLKFDKLLLRDLMIVSTPVMLNELMWALGTSMQARLLGQLGKTVVSANSIISIVQQLSTVAVFGVASAAAVMIGKAIGEGDMQKARDRGYTFKLFSVLFGLVVFGLILLLRTVAIDFYNVSADTKALAHQMVYVAAIIGFFISISGISIVGILRGGGDTKFSLLAEMLALWCVAVPLAYFAAFVLQFPPVLVFAVMKIDEPVKAIICFVRMHGTKWLRNVTRTGAVEDKDIPTQIPDA